MEHKGYKVEEREMNITGLRWNNHYLNYDFYKTTRMCYCVRLSANVFISACKNKKLPSKGLIMTEQGHEQEVKRGVKYGVENNHLKIGITLLNHETNEVKHWASMADCAKDFNIAKSNFSRTMKNKVIGDTVKLKKQKFIIVGNLNIV
jgi:hypothetical protein